MADLLPKVKLYVFLSIFQIFINIGIFFASLKFDLIGLFGMVGSSFIPLVGFVSLALSGFPVEAVTFIGIFTGLISGFQIYIIAEIIISHIPFLNV